MTVSCAFAVYSSSNRGQYLVQQVIVHPGIATTKELYMPRPTRIIASAGLVLLLSTTVAACGTDEEADVVASTTTAAETPETTEASAEAGDTIADLAVATPSLSTLVAAATAADLVATLANPDGEFTVFAPTNDAFAAIQSTVDTLLKPENKALLTSVLTYHVVPGTILSTDLAEGDQVVTTVLGETLTVNLTGGVVTITDSTGAKATVEMADIEASNGVVHVIDKVLIPAAAA